VKRRPDYDRAADGWARGATLVYGPLADALLARGSVDWTGCRVLDVGAGTGAVSDRLLGRGADVVAADLSPGMLAYARDRRPSAVVADVLALPFTARSFGAVVASFVLNHLDQPVAGLGELARTARPGARLLASVFGLSYTHPGREAIDAVATRWGWQAPAWYVETKERAVPLLASPGAMGDAARSAGLVDIDAEETSVDVGLTRADELVAYRLGQAHVTDFLAALSSTERTGLIDEARAAVDEAAGVPMAPYRPEVVFLAATVP
jgi:SAM-dependent methyltransferase